MIYTTFSIFKNKFKKEGTQQPDYKLSAKGADGKFIEIGVGWIKDMKDGSKYISCKLTENPAPVLTDIEKENLKLIREKEIKAREEKEKAFNDF